MDYSFLKEQRIFNTQQAVSVLTANRNIFFSWAPGTITQIRVGRYIKGLSFPVDAYKFKGLVTVSVNGRDYYDVHFSDQLGNVEEITDIFAGDLVDVIDEHVEKQPCYRR